MATSPDQVHGHQYVDFDEYIDIQLRKAGSTIKTTDVMTSVVGVLTLITLYLLLFVICDHWLVPGGFGQVTRSVMLAVVGSIACVWMAVKVLIPWRRRVSGLYAASTIEKASPALKSSLINLVDISRSGHEVSPEIYQSIERRAALALTHVDVNEAVDRRSLLRLSNVLLAVVVLFCLYWIFSPKNPGTSLWRAIMPSSEVGVATRTEIFNVHPGDKDVLARSQLEVTADIRGEVPPQSFLFFTTADRKFVDERVEMRQENEGIRKFRCVLTGDNGAGILQNMTYRIVAGDATTPEYKIRVIQPPAATIDSLRLDSPEYTHRESVTQTTGAIDALEGTRVTLKAHANMPLRSAVLQFFDDETAAKRAEEIPLMVSEGTKLQVDWKLEIRSDGTYPHYYRIYCTSTEGESDPRPSLYSYVIRPDQPPEITLRDPKTDLELPANAVLPLAIEASDPDFKLTYVDLIIEKDGSPVPGQPVFSGSVQQLKTSYHWQFKEFRPKDTITYWLEAKDNRQPIANVTRTPKLRVRITKPVSEEQVQKQLAMNEKRQQDEAKKSEADQPPPEKSDEENSADNHEKRPQSKQPRKNNQAGKGQDDKARGNTPPDQEADGRNDPGQQPDKTKGDQDDPAQQGKNSPDKDDTHKQRPNPDKPEDDAQSITDLDRVLNQQKPDQTESKQKKSEQNQSDEKKKSDQNQSGGDKSGQSSGPQDPKQQGSSSDSPRGGQNAEQKPDQGNEKKNPADGSKPGNEQNGDQKTGDTKNPGSGQKESKGQTAKPGEQNQDSHGAKTPGDQPKRDQGNGNKPSEMKNEGAKSGAQQDANNQQQPGGERGQQPEKRENGSAEGTREKKDQGDQKSDRGDQKPKGEQPSGRPDQQKQSGNPEPQKQPGDNSSGNQKFDEQNPKAQNSQEKKADDKSGQQPDQSPAKTGKPDGKPEGPQDPKTPLKNPDGASDSGKDDSNNPQKNNSGQPQKGSQPGDQNGDDQKGGGQNNKSGTSQNSQKDGSEANKSENGSQDKGSQNSGGNPADRKPGESGDQKPSSNEADSNQPGKREPGNNEPGKKDATKETGDNSRERGDSAQKKSGDKAGQASRKSERDPNRQPNQGQAGSPNGEQQQQQRKDQAENGDAASGKDSKPTKERRDDRQPNNPVDAKTPESKRQPLDEQPSTVRDTKNRTGTPGSETDPSRASQPEGTPQPGTTDQPGREQATEKKNGGQGDQQKSAQQKEGGAQQKSGGSQEQPGSKQESSGQSGQPKSGGSKEGQPQTGQGESGKGGGQKGQEGSKSEGKPGAGEAGQKGQEGNQPSNSGKPGNQSTAGGGQSNQGNNGGGFNNGQGPGAGGSLDDTTNRANLDYAKKATDLVLNKLENQLQRGKIDKKIEEEMGWNKDQIRRFVERMRKEAQAAQDPNTPSSEARRLQFEETLKSLNLRSTARRRQSQGPKNDDAEIGGRRSIPPPEYRDLYEAYTKSLAKPVPRQSDEKK